MKMWAIHTFHWALLYGAFVLKEPEWENATLFFAWMLIVFGVPAILISPITETRPEDRAGTVLMLLTRFQSAVTLVAFAVAGWVATAIGWTLLMLVAAAHRSVVRSELRKRRALDESTPASNS